MVQAPLIQVARRLSSRFLIWINFVRRMCRYHKVEIMAPSASVPDANEAMPIGQGRLWCLSLLLIVSMAAVDAHAGVTISDRRYWPSEARTSPGRLIDILPQPYVYPEAGVAAGSWITPRKKPRRNR